MGTLEIVLIAAVILIPLAIAVAVTLWTLEPAAQRAERARRGRRRAAASAAPSESAPAPTSASLPRVSNAKPSSDSMGREP